MKTYGFSVWFYMRAPDLEVAVEKANQATKSTDDVIFDSPMIEMDAPGDKFFEQKKKEMEWRP